MNWFKEQLRSREEADNADLADAVDSLASAVMGGRLHEAFTQKEITSSAIEEICKYYHCKVKNKELPPQIKTIDEQIEYFISPFGIKSRKVTLDPGWYHNASGAMIALLKENDTAIALIPGKLSGYWMIDFKSGNKIKVNKKSASSIKEEAFCFYEPLPQRALTIKDLLQFMLRQLTFSDIALYLILMVLSSLLGLLSPLFTRWLFSDVLEAGDKSVLIALFVFMVCFSISNLCFQAFKSLIDSRIGIKQNIAVQAAVMNRIMSLPPAFFREYSSGELSQRASYVQSLCSTLFSAIGMTGLTSLFSLIYIGQIFVFAPSLVIPSIVITVLSVTLSVITTFAQMNITKEKMALSAQTSGLTYSTITGIQKIKLSGAEKRMFSRWAKQYSSEAKLDYDPPVFLKLNGTFSVVISLFGTMILYAVAVSNRVSVADYYAFNTSYGMVSSAFMSLLSIAVTMANIKPILEMARPILEREPEAKDDKEIVNELRGGIELSHVSFRYEDSSVLVIDDLSFTVHPGEYLAIVGPTGCGKSTLLRLLLGFELPQKGSISYDNKDLRKLDPESLRKKIGVVMQDGKLFAGDIYSNIVITAPQLGMDAAWEAARIASINEDILSMPMGMHTLITEGQGGISGGQKQRLMIARAVVTRPKILMFDEATSALDNITQKKVSEAIDSLSCTRIVIAHRLSTIQHADRIIYLDQGKILEEGNYQELIAKDGYFAKLVERQRLDMEEKE